MSIRRITRLLLWLCATVALSLGASFAAEPGQTRLDAPPQILTPVPDQPPQTQHGTVRAGPRTAPSGVQTTIPLAARETLSAIELRHGDPPPGYVGGRTFQNRERVLPRGRYREYDVRPKVPGKNRGAERIVIDQRTGKSYYTADHYRTFVPMN
ncbi:MAG: ribonuclease domain-containing protein [Nitrospirota bacterium]